MSAEKLDDAYSVQPLIVLHSLGVVNPDNDDGAKGHTLTMAPVLLHVPHALPAYRFAALGIGDPATEPLLPSTTPGSTQADITKLLLAPSSM